MRAVSVRVLIVDDQPLFRRVARELLHHRGSVVVGEAACAATAVEAATRLAPDAVLLDIRLGDDSGFDVAWELRTAAPDAAVLLMSNLDYGQSQERMRFCGARGFVLKSELATASLANYWPA
jgi:two-component system nitrate/nitrite response regulator NarL